MSVDWNWFPVLGVVLVTVVLYVISKYLDRQQDGPRQALDDLDERLGPVNQDMLDEVRQEFVDQSDYDSALYPDGRIYHSGGIVPSPGWKARENNRRFVKTKREGGPFKGTKEGRTYKNVDTGGYL